MRYTDKLTGLAVLLLLAACNNSSGSGDNLVMDTTIQPPAAATTVTNTGTNTQAVVPPVAAPAANNTGALNPAHGQPGHRCDLAVGAPLNSQPTATTTPATVTTPAVTTQPAVITAPATTTTTFPSSPAATNPAATTIAPGMNPAHGQPGHRCDIAVGAPLNSKPTAATATTMPLPLTPSLPTATPVATTPAKTENVTVAVNPTAPGMNPPHGQPGHRCDISVGAPLNSKPNPPAKAKETAVNAPAATDSKVLPAAEKEKQELERNKEADKAPTKGN